MVEDAFKSSKPFTLRKEESASIREKFPDRVPVVIERSRVSGKIPLIDKSKYLVPNDLTVYHL